MAKISPTNLARVLKAYIKWNDLNQNDVAKLFDIDKANLSRFLNGKQVTTDHYINILNWLNKRV